MVMPPVVLMMAAMARIKTLARTERTVDLTITTVLIHVMHVVSEIVALVEETAEMTDATTGGKIAVAAAETVVISVETNGTDKITDLTTGKTAGIAMIADHARSGTKDRVAKVEVVVTWVLVDSWEWVG